MWWRFKKLKEIKNIDFDKHNSLEIVNASKEYKKKYRNNKNVYYIAKGIPFGNPDRYVKRGDRILLYNKYNNSVRIAEVITTPFGMMPPLFNGNETLVDHIVLAIEIKDEEN